MNKESEALITEPFESIGVISLLRRQSTAYKQHGDDAAKSPNDLGKSKTEQRTAYCANDLCRRPRCRQSSSPCRRKGASRIPSSFLSCRAPAEPSLPD